MPPFNWATACCHIAGRSRSETRRGSSVGFGMKTRQGHAQAGGHHALFDGAQPVLVVGKGGERVVGAWHGAMF